MATDKVKLIKKIYLYLVSLITLVIIIISVSGLLNTVLKTFVFKKADNYYYEIGTPVTCNYSMPPETKEAIQATKLSDEECAKKEKESRKKEDLRLQANRHRDFARNISLLAVAIPLFAFHWILARKKNNL